MCGIAGFYGYYEGDLRDNIKSTLASISSRGPDSNGHYYESFNESKQILLLHTRLKIIDLDNRANQPFRYKNYILSFNGEIYNYLELKKHLISKGNTFISNSDTEVLIQHYDKYGYKGIDDFEGMFALSIFDKNDYSLVLSRDRFGEKPLYISESSRYISYGSEVDALQKINNKNFEVNEKLVFKFLNKGYRTSYSDPEISFFKKVKSVRPNQVISYNNNLQKSNSKYWSPCITRDFENIEQSKKEIRESLIKSVELRMRSDVPIAFFLSGGIDSNAIISIAKNILNKDIACFSLVAKDQKFEEIEVIRDQVKNQRLNHTELEISQKNFIENMQELISYYYAPVATISIFAIWKLYKEVFNKGFKVTISGHGGDEIFAGYYYHHLLYLRDIKNKKEKFDIKKTEWEKFVLPYVNNPILKNLDLFVNNENEPIEYLYNNNSNIKEVFRDQIYKFKTDNIHYHKKSLKNRMLNEIFNEVIPVVLAQEDLNSMYYSIENRSPFLDKNIFETALSVPTSEYISKGYNKSLLRDSLKEILPNSIRKNRSKIGLNFSLKEYFSLNSENKKFLLSDSMIFEYINKNKLKELIQDEKKFYQNSQFIFNFISSKVFLDKFS